MSGAEYLARRLRLLDPDMPVLVDADRALLEVGATPEAEEAFRRYLAQTQRICHTLFGSTCSVLGFFRTSYTVGLALRRPWNTFMSLREFVQNAMDARDIHGGTYKAYTADWLYVVENTRGSARPTDILLYGASEKPCWARGRFGVGMKEAMIYLESRGYPVAAASTLAGDTFLYRFFVLGPRRVLFAAYHAGRDMVPGTLVAMDSRALSEAEHYFSSMAGVAAPLEEAFLSGGVEAYTVEDYHPGCRERPGREQILLDPRYGNRLYVRDIFVNRGEKLFGRRLLFGYNLWWVELDEFRTNLADSYEALRRIRGLHARLAGDFYSGRLRLPDSYAERLSGLVSHEELDLEVSRAHVYGLTDDARRYSDMDYAFEDESVLSLAYGLALSRLPGGVYVYVSGSTDTYTLKSLAHTIGTGYSGIVAVRDHVSLDALTRALSALGSRVELVPDNKAIMNTLKCITKGSVPLSVLPPYKRLPFDILECLARLVTGREARLMLTTTRSHQYDDVVVLRVPGDYLSPVPGVLPDYVARDVLESYHHELSHLYARVQGWQEKDLTEGFEAALSTTFRILVEDYAAMLRVAAEYMKTGIIDMGLLLGPGFALIPENTEAARMYMASYTGYRNRHLFCEAVFALPAELYGLAFTPFFTIPRDSSVHIILEELWRHAASGQEKNNLLIYTPPKGPGLDAFHGSGLPRALVASVLGYLRGRGVDFGIDDLNTWPADLRALYKKLYECDAAPEKCYPGYGDLYSELSRKTGLSRLLEYIFSH